MNGQQRRVGGNRPSSSSVVRDTPASLPSATHAPLTVVSAEVPRASVDALIEALADAGYSASSWDDVESAQSRLSIFLPMVDCRPQPNFVVNLIVSLIDKIHNIEAMQMRRIVNHQSGRPQRSPRKTRTQSGDLGASAAKSAANRNSSVNAVFSVLSVALVCALVGLRAVARLGFME